jgi:type IV pilus assembly protein PilV
MQPNFRLRVTRLGRGRQRGVSLLEVLISLVIVGIGVLGLIGMQARAMSNQRDSFDRKAAAELLAQITERMRANHLGFMAGGYSSSMLPTDSPASGVSCLTATPCTPAQLATNDVAAWQRSIRERLPAGGAVIAPSTGTGFGTGSSAMRITMVWREAAPTTGADAGCTAVSVTDTSFRCLVAEVFP